MDAKTTLGEPRVYISRSALLHNVSVIRSHLRDGVRLCAVLKADGYGHSAQIVADALCNFSSKDIEAPAVDALAVATIDEAAALGQVGVPVMVLRPIENVYVGRERQRIESAIAAGWMLTLSSREAAGDVARIAVAMNRRASMQVMVDTGMTREGAPLDAVPDLLQAVESYASLKLAGLYTHFANADVPSDPLTGHQLGVFRSATHMHTWKNPRIICHAANSGAVFFCPPAQLDMVRPGLALYGIDPSGRPSVDRPLRPALKWTAPLLMIRNVRKGEAVGYGGTWIAPRDTRLGLVPIGYADGYLRAFSNRAVMMVAGQPCQVVGRVSMDSTMIDLGNVASANVGDDVTILDDDPLSPASVYNLAKFADTIPYELFCRIGNRVARVAVEPADAAEFAADEAMYKRESA